MSRYHIMFQKGTVLGQVLAGTLYPLWSPEKLLSMGKPHLSSLTRGVEFLLITDPTEAGWISLGCPATPITSSLKLSEPGSPLSSPGPLLTSPLPCLARLPSQTLKCCCFQVSVLILLTATIFPW